MKTTTASPPTVLNPRDRRRQGEIDILISALGYEHRCTYAAQRLLSKAQVRVAIAFQDRTLLHYSENQKWFVKNEFSIIPYTQNRFADDLLGVLQGAATRIARERLRVTIDISSMSRPMIAQIVCCFSRLSEFNVDCEFIYCPAEFSNPSLSLSPLTKSEPVIPEYAGWSTRPDLPTSAVVGLGYEYGRALGTLDYLEPSVAWAFIPHGEDKRYDRAVREMNSDFRNLIPVARIQEYRVDDPFGCFIRVESLVHGLIRESRPTLLPFGPKIFALICILIADIHRPDVTVWRVSGDQLGPPEDRVANGKTIRLPVQFGTDQH